MGARGRRVRQDDIGASFKSGWAWLGSIGAAHRWRSILEVVSDQLGRLSVEDPIAVAVNQCGFALGKVSTE